MLLLIAYSTTSSSLLAHKITPTLGFSYSSEIKELTPEIVNELIDKTYVYQQTKLNGKKYQEIDIHYAGVGIIAIPLNEYELEDAFQQGIKNTKTA